MVDKSHFVGPSVASLVFVKPTDLFSQPSKVDN